MLFGLRGAFAGDLAALDIQALARRAAGGDTRAMVLFGKDLAAGSGCGQDRQAAKVWLLKAARRGDAEGQAEFGRLEFMGSKSSESDPELVDAVRWFQKSACQGNATGQDLLGVAYQLGFGVMKDPAAARRWLEKAARQGHPDGMNDLGSLYCGGCGVAEDRAKAVYWLRKSAGLGNDPAFRNLGTCLQRGMADQIDPAGLAALFGQAALAPTPGRLFYRGIACRYGLGVEPDPARAGDYLQQAAGAGVFEARELLDERAAGRRPEAEGLAGPDGCAADRVEFAEFHDKYLRHELVPGRRYAFAAHLPLSMETISDPGGTRVIERPIPAFDDGLEYSRFVQKPDLDGCRTLVVSVENERVAIHSIRP